MTKRAGALAVVALASAAGAAGGCHPLELRRGPACVSGFQPGQTLHRPARRGLRREIGFLYKDSWLGPDASDRTPSCRMARDGLQTDDVLTFTLTEPGDRFDGLLALGGRFAAGGDRQPGGGGWAPDPRHRRRHHCQGD